MLAWELLRNTVILEIPIICQIYFALASRSSISEGHGIFWLLDSLIK